MQKLSRGGRRSPLGRLGSQEALEGGNIETLQQPSENQRNWPRVALSGAIREREIHEKTSGLQHFCITRIRFGSILEAVFGASWGASWMHLGGLSGEYCRQFLGLFGASREFLGASWGPLGGLLGPLGASWGLWGAS